MTVWLLVKLCSKWCGKSVSFSSQSIIFLKRVHASWCSVGDIQRVDMCKISKWNLILLLCRKNLGNCLGNSAMKALNFNFCSTVIGIICVMSFKLFRKANGFFETFEETDGNKLLYNFFVQFWQYLKRNAPIVTVWHIIISNQIVHIFVEMYLNIWSI